jgi:tRNA (guanine9-N1)-methyltransferase
MASYTSSARDAWRQKQKEAAAAAAAARAKEREEKLAAMDEDERAAFDRAEHADGEAKYELKKQQWAKVDDAFASGLRVVLDLSYAERMNDKEKRSLARQLEPCWGANKKANAPVCLHIAGLGGCPSECLPKGGAEMGSWKVHRHEQGVEEVFARDELVFLSPDADEALEAPLDRGSVYVIGGFVDSAIQKDVTLKRAEAVGARARRLPLEEHAPNGVSNPRLPLTVTAVLDILLALNAGEPWDTALGSAIAPRHQCPGHRSGRKARRAERQQRGANTSAGEGEPGPATDPAQPGASTESVDVPTSVEHQDGQSPAAVRPSERRQKERQDGKKGSGAESGVSQEEQKG